MHRNRWFLLLNEKPPIGKNLDEKLQKLLVMLKHEPRPHRIFETLSRVRAEPELLMNPAAEVLDPIREIINAISKELSEISDPSARRKRLFSFLNDIPNNEIPKYFDGVKHDEYRLMLRNSAFELLIDEEIFVAVMN